MLTVSVPATTANIGAGFDIWGMALNLRNSFSFEITGEPSTSAPVELEFSYDQLVTSTAGSAGSIQMPRGADNLIAKCYYKYFEITDKTPSPVRIKAEIGIPLERGLGASSTAVLGGLVIANETVRNRGEKALSLDQIFKIASQIEGHPDNVAPALWGGWILTITDRGLPRCFSLPVQAPLQLAGIIPHLHVPTEKARSVLPAAVDLETVSFQASRTAMLTHLLGKEKWSDGDRNLFFHALEDKIHQPKRAQFIPGMYETIEYWRSTGCLGGFLSGSGPAIIGFWDKNTDLSQFELGRALSAENVDSTEIKLQIDRTGLMLEND